MANCPLCNKKISLLYQLRAAFDKPSLLWRNIRQTIWICNNCFEELTPTSRSWNIFYGLIVISVIFSISIFAFFGKYELPISYAMSEVLIGAILVVPIILMYFVWWCYVAKFKKIEQIK